MCRVRAVTSVYAATSRTCARISRFPRSPGRAHSSAQSTDPPYSTPELENRQYISSEEPESEHKRETRHTTKTRYISSISTGSESRYIRHVSSPSPAHKTTQRHKLRRSQAILVSSERRGRARLRGFHREQGCALAASHPLPERKQNVHAAGGSEGSREAF